ncbi:unnamed protein product [Nesidiocoris tenuis]|uniref:Uncharacterized protein n=1 Tax=Nesidiocoris tenuis TaxID=355587 RepID=A0A6H5GLG2_9HEMI|nr:unnamed protein product [Nesidiocoris tenuis]
MKFPIVYLTLIILCFLCAAAEPLIKPVQNGASSSKKIVPSAVLRKDLQQQGHTRQRRIAFPRMDIQKEAHPQTGDFVLEKKCSSLPLVVKSKLPDCSIAKEMRRYFFENLKSNRFVYGIGRNPQSIPDKSAGDYRPFFGINRPYTQEILSTNYGTYPIRPDEDSSAIRNQFALPSDDVLLQVFGGRSHLVSGSIHRGYQPQSEIPPRQFFNTAALPVANLQPNLQNRPLPTPIPMCPTAEIATTNQYSGLKPNCNEEIYHHADRDRFENSFLEKLLLDFMNTYKQDPRYQVPMIWRYFEIVSDHAIVRAGQFPSTQQTNCSTCQGDSPGISDHDFHDKKPVIIENRPPIWGNFSDGIEPTDIITSTVDNNELVTSPVVDEEVNDSSKITFPGHEYDIDPRH